RNGHVTGGQTCALPIWDLQKVLGQLDEAAKKFRTAQANFVWTQYNKVINDVADTQKGKIYFRRTGKETQMAANITEPDVKQVIRSEERRVGKRVERGGG